MDLAVATVMKRIVLSHFGRTPLAEQTTIVALAFVVSVHHARSPDPEA